MADNFPPTLTTMYPWTIRDAQRIRLYYPQGVTESTASTLVENCETDLQRIEELLQVEPLVRVVSLFLFPDKTLAQRAITHTVYDNFLVWQGLQSLCLVYEDWSALRALVALNLAHAVSYGRITTTQIVLLEVGLARYVATQLYPQPVASTPDPVLAEPLYYLANNDLFVKSIKDPIKATNTLDHAANFWQYLSIRYGLPTALRLHRVAAPWALDDTSERFTVAVERILATSVDNLDADWRSQYAQRLK